MTMQNLDDITHAVRLKDEPEEIIAFFGNKEYAKKFIQAVEPRGEVLEIGTDVYIDVQISHTSRFDIQS